MASPYPVIRNKIVERYKAGRLRSEIAEELGLSYANVKQQIFKATKAKELEITDRMIRVRVPIRVNEALRLEARTRDIELNELISRLLVNIVGNPGDGDLFKAVLDD